MSKPEASLLARLVDEGLAHHRNGRFEEAEDLYRQVLALDPDHADALHLQGMLAYQEGRLDQAVASISRAIAAHPRATAYHANLGNVLQAQDRLGEAVESYRRALALRPDVAEVHLNLGNVLQALGDVDGARAAFARALALGPDLAEARAAQAMALLLQGDFARGWEEFEGRWKTRDHDTPWRPYAQPLWQGERPSRGPVLIWGEQGVGDEIMFAGLVPDAIATGVELLLECDPRLVPLFRRSFPSLRVLARGEGKPGEDQGFAAHTPSGSLPRLFRTSLAGFAATTSPYLFADPEKRTMLRDHYDRGRGLVGLAWHTRAGKTGRRRSIDLEALAPLFTVPGVRWISLQYGEHASLAAQIEAAQAPVLVDRSVDQFADIDRFAAQVAALDLVITIDNSTAHLASALGIPTWLLLPFAPDWRWLLKTDRSPWYPTMRIFRQTRPGDWASPLTQLQAALASWTVSPSG